MTKLLLFIKLFAAAHTYWPDVPSDDLAIATREAVLADDGRPHHRASVLLAIAHHEADLHPRTVSWRENHGSRHDYVWLIDKPAPDSHGWLVACGYLQRVGRTIAECELAIDPHVSMLMGLEELDEIAERHGGTLEQTLLMFSCGGRDWAHPRRCEWVRRFTNDARALDPGYDQSVHK